MLTSEISEAPAHAFTRQVQAVLRILCSIAASSPLESTLRLSYTQILSIAPIELKASLPDMSTTLPTESTLCSAMSVVRAGLCSTWRPPPTLSRPSNVSLMTSRAPLLLMLKLPPTLVTLLSESLIASKFGFKATWRSPPTCVSAGKSPKFCERLASAWLLKILRLPPTLTRLGMAGTPTMPLLSVMSKSPATVLRAWNASAGEIPTELTFRIARFPSTARHSDVGRR